MAKVLFIEDNVGWQDILRELLETAGHNLKRATTFESAIGILGGKEQFDVIVFDLRLGEKFPGDNAFAWLDALLQGMDSRKIKLPPIIILTGVTVTKRQIIHVFTEYRGNIFGFFEKTSFEPKEFLQCIKKSTERAPVNPKTSRSFIHLLFYTLLMTVIMLSTFLVLIWSVRQISDPLTQQTILQVGGAVIVVIAVFITVFSQNTKIESVIDAISKIWRG